MSDTKAIRGGMTAVDFRRMFTGRLFYIMLGICLITPVLIVVMTAMLDGSVSVDPQTGVETVVRGFDNVWQVIGSVGGAGSAASMDMTSMCNMNLVYFMIAVFVGLFVSEDFKSGYAKNIFAVRVKTRSYVTSKIRVCTFAGALMIFAFFVGAVIGGKIAGLPFAFEGVSAWNIAMCLISKVLLVGVFTSVSTAVSVFAKEKRWISIVGSCAAGMLLFMMISIAAPLNASLMNVVMCLVGSILFGVGFECVGTVVLSGTDIL